MSEEAVRNDQRSKLCEPLEINDNVQRQTKQRLTVVSQVDGKSHEGQHH